jgi:hypothetical protein
MQNLTLNQALSLIDGAIAVAPLNRRERNDVEQAFQALVKYITDTAKALDNNTSEHNNQIDNAPAAATPEDAQENE